MSMLDMLFVTPVLPKLGTGKVHRLDVKEDCNDSERKGKTRAERSLEIESRVAKLLKPVLYHTVKQIAESTGLADTTVRDALSRMEKKQEAERTSIKGCTHWRRAAKPKRLHHGRKERKAV